MNKFEMTSKGTGIPFEVVRRCVNAPSVTGITFEYVNKF